VVRILPPAFSMSEPTAAREGVPASPPQSSPLSFWHPGSFVALLRGREVLLAILFLTIAFFVLTAIVVGGHLQPTIWDIVVTHEIQELPPVIGVPLTYISLPGFVPWNWLLGTGVILFMLARRWYAEAVFTMLAAGGGLAAEIIKNFIDRPRPTPEFAHITTVLNSYSFPSGHVTGYVASFGFLFYLAYTLLPRHSLIRWVLLIVLGLLILLVGPSRVYMGQHWASDALAGYALGFAYLLLVITAYRWWLHRHPEPPTPLPSASPTS
jgi:membrane-associated phospholipid phosphatase